MISKGETVALGTAAFADFAVVQQLTGSGAFQRLTGFKGAGQANDYGGTDPHSPIHAELRRALEQLGTSNAICLAQDQLKRARDKLAALRPKSHTDQ